MRNECLLVVLLLCVGACSCQPRIKAHENQISTATFPGSESGKSLILSVSINYDKLEKIADRGPALRNGFMINNGSVQAEVQFTNIPDDTVLATESFRRYQSKEIFYKNNTIFLNNVPSGYWFRFAMFPDLIYKTNWMPLYENDSIVLRDGRKLLTIYIP